MVKGGPGREFMCSKHWCIIWICIVMLWVYEKGCETFGEREGGNATHISGRTNAVAFLHSSHFPRTFFHTLSSHCLNRRRKNRHQQQRCPRTESAKSQCCSKSPSLLPSCADEQYNTDKHAELPTHPQQTQKESPSPSHIRKFCIGSLCYLLLYVWG